MSVPSLSSAFSLGIQSAKGTPATNYKTALATQSGLQPTFDIRTAPLEHPGGASRATKQKSTDARTGYLAKPKSTFILRPNFIGTALMGLGFGVSSANASGVYTHTFTIAAAASAKWLSALWYTATEDAAMTLKATDVRLTKLSINGTPDSVECQLEGSGLSLGEASGSETLVAESANEILPTAGSLTVQNSSTALFTAVRGVNFEFTQELLEDDRTLFTSTRQDLPIKSQNAQITFTGVDISRALYRKVVNAGASNTTASLTPFTGDLTYTFQSSSFAGGSTPYSLTITMPSVQYEFNEGTIQAQNDEQVRVDVVAKMIDNLSTPLTIALVNTISAYVA